MTKEEAKKILACRGNGYSEEDFNDAIEVAFNCIPSIPSDLDEAAEKTSQSAYSEPTAAGFAKRSFFKRGFKAGAEWMAGQFVWVGGEPTGWFRANDGSEYATGLDLKEPIKLPADFYVRKK